MPLSFLEAAMKVEATFSMAEIHAVPLMVWIGDYFHKSLVDSNAAHHLHGFRSLLPIEKRSTAPGWKG